jgi:hypothetical protein
LWRLLLLFLLSRLLVALLLATLSRILLLLTRLLILLAALVLLAAVLLTVHILTLSIGIEVNSEHPDGCSQLLKAGVPDSQSPATASANANRQ